MASPLHTRWYRNNLRLVVVILGSLAAVCGTIAGRVSSHRGGSAHEEGRQEKVAQLSVPDSCLDFGSVWEADQFAWTLPVENCEMNPVEVRSVSVSCNCFSVEPESFVLKPNERRDLRLKIDLNSKTSETGEVSVQFRLLLNAGASGGKEQGPEWTVRGKVRRALVVAPSTFLGRFSELSQLPPWSIPLEVSAPLGSVSARCNRHDFTASITLPPAEGKAVLQLTPPSALPVGPFELTVDLKPVLKNGESLPERHMRFRGIVVSDLQIAPTAVQVGGRRVGETFEDVVTIQSLNGRPLKGVKAEAEGEGLSVEVIEGVNRFRVRQGVRGSGQQTNLVRFTAESGGRTSTAVLMVSYVGIGPN